MIIAADIEEALDSLDVKLEWKDIAAAVNLSESSFSHLKNGTEMKFLNLLKVADFVYKGSYLEKFKNWCLSFNQPKNMRYALEYLAVNRQVEELDTLVEKIYNERNDKALLNTAKGYEILSMYLKGFESSDILSELRAYEPKSIEMKILSVIIEVWARYRLREFKTMQSLIEGLERNIAEVKDDYIRKSFTMQLKEAKSYAVLYNSNNVVLARNIATEIINENFSATFNANASYLLGISYLFDDYDMCLGYMDRYKKLLKEIGREEMISTINRKDIPFVNNCWRKKHSSLVNIDPSELAHYEAQQGNKEVALELLEESIKNEGISGFKLYYKALATQDDSLFMQSMVYFVSKKGDKFFANLPYRFLKGNPEYKPIADMLMED